MQEIITAFMSHDLKALIESIGLIGVYFIVFAESGLFIGFFLPGDSLLFTAGLLASPAFHFFNIWTLLIGSWIAAILGDNVGYAFGKKVGPALFNRKHTILFHPENLKKAQNFYEKYGGKAIILARFVPVVRTFAPIVAGIGTMNYKKFIFFNFIGGTLWVWGMVFLGYFLGRVIPESEVDKYILPVIVLIIVLSVLPPIYHLWKEKRQISE
jgi:membrane-associated protein